jgi:prepilin-type N-terminal cleavage/methylation domain-containing protein
MLEKMQSARTVSWTAGSRHSIERGFTLIEMMVVLVLIFLIVGISLPNLRRAIVRSDLLSEVKKVQMAVMFSRIHAIKNGRRVALKILDDDAEQEGGTIIAWVDDNGDGSSAGEEIIKQWRVGHNVGNIITLAPDGATSLDLFPLAGGGELGVVFLPNGTVITNVSGDVGIGTGAVVIGDSKFNDIRLTINAGAGTILQEMWNPAESEWTTEMKYWLY